jgi:hypothetical protein
MMPKRFRAIRSSRIKQREPADQPPSRRRQSAGHCRFPPRIDPDANYELTRIDDGLRLGRSSSYGVSPLRVHTGRWRGIDFPADLM